MPVPRPALARRRLWLLAALVLGVALVAIALLRGGDSVPLPGPGEAPLPPSGDPWAWSPARAADFAARAVPGSAHVIYAKSPGGVEATAARVIRFRPLIERAAAAGDVDPNLLEALVFLESAGRPDAMASNDPAAAAGLTQILAETGQSLLGMRIDTARSGRLTRRINRALLHLHPGLAARLERERARIDQRFDPRAALAGTVRYLVTARARFGREDLAAVSYHMGIGNLTEILSRYGHGSVPYGQLFFDTAPDRNESAWRLLASLGDDSSLYYWKLRGAEQIMRLYRTDRGALRRLAALEVARNSSEQVLHPPGHTIVFADPRALRDAYSRRQIVRLPRQPQRVGLAYDPGMGRLARRLKQPRALYRGLRPAALAMLECIGARVQGLSGTSAPLLVTSTVRDARYQQILAATDPEAVSDYSLHTTGWAFDVARAYRSRAQAAAFQFVLDRLQALNAIAWVREPAAIHVTVAPGTGARRTGGRLRCWGTNP